MKTVLFALFALVLGGFALADMPKVVIISPNDLVAAWQTEYAAKVPAITGGDYEVVSTDTIYAAHPYAAENTDGRPRNPAESIHAFIVSKANEVQQFILGGPWVDIEDLATNKVMKLATGETLTLANAVPGVRISPDERYRSPTDMYYACRDAKNLYAWDADGDGRYLNTNEFAQCDMTASVAVTRLPLVTWSEWKHADGTLFTQRELLAAYVEKLRKGLSSDFDGANRYGIYGYLINESGVQKLGGPNETWVERKETAFYDNGYNMFDPARGSDDFWLVEGVSRRRIRDQIAVARPVDDVNGFLEATFNRKHSDWTAARTAWKTENYALRFYYAHGARGGGHGFSMDDYKADGCGLTLFDDCAGPCSTGKIEFDANGVYQMNYAIACVMSPYGGSLATINNSDFGIADLNNYWKGFTPNDSWRYANNYLVGFVQENKSVGEAWQANVTDFVTNYKYNTSAIDTWMLAEEMMLGDPLVKLPAVETNLAYADGITYTGLADKTDVVVSLQINGDKVLNTPTVPLKVMDGLTTSGTSLTLCTGEGGIGGKGIVFTGEKGTLTLAGDAPFYVAGVKNVASVRVNGSHQTIDFDGVELDGSVMGQLTISSANDITIRSATEGALSKIRNNLSVPRNGSVRLATWNAFGSAADGVIYLAKNAELIIGANPFYHDGNDRGESLNATITPMSLTADAPAKIRVEKGGFFTPAKALANANYLSYEIDARDGLGGNVTVPNNAKLTLMELPLSKIEMLSVESGATLVIPADKTLDDLLSSGSATLAAGVKVVCGETTTTLAKEKNVDGSAYVVKAYYTSAETDWTSSTKVSLEKDGAANETVTAATVIRFAADKGPVYVHSDVACSKIEVVDGANLQLGYWNNRWTVPTDWTVDVEDGATLTIARWSNTSTGAIQIGDNVTLNGEGTVAFASTVTSVTCGNISGTATIALPVGVTLSTTGVIENPIVVSEGCRLEATAAGGVTTYRAVQSRTLYWTGSSGAVQDWRTVSGIGLKDAANQSTTFESGDTIVINVSAILYLHDAVTGIKIRLEGEGTNVRFLRSGDASGADFVMKGIEVEVAAGATLTIPRHQNAINSGWDSYQPAAKPKQSTVSDSAISGEGTLVIESNAAAVFTGTSSIKIKKIVIDGDLKSVRKIAETSEITTSADGYRIGDPTVVNGFFVYSREEDDEPLAMRVVRAHPRLTRGLPRESLIGVRYTAGSATALVPLTVKFAFTNCASGDLSELALWKMNDPAHAYAFAEADATMVAESTIVDGAATFSPEGVTVQEGDVLWVTAKVNPAVDSAAEIRTAIRDEDISKAAPHKVFAHYYRSGAYFRADRVTATSCAPLEDATAERLQSLNDLIVINDLEPVYDEVSDSFSTTWNVRRDNSAGVAYVKGLRDAYHPQAMVRLGLTKNDTKMTKNGETAHPLAFAVSTPTYREQLIAAIVKVMEDEGVDGLDVDWEYPGVNSGTFTTAATWARDWQNYGLFLRDLAELFFDRGWVLSMCTNLGWTMPSDGTMGANRATFMNVLHVVDYIDSMAYGDATLNASPQVMQKAIKAVTDCGVPTRRIVVGQAMYAYEVQNPGWNAVVNWLAAAYPESAMRRWDADLVWIDRCVTNNQGKILTTNKETFEGPSSYHAKINWCREHEMGGAMSWGYYTDVDWNRADLMSLGRHHAKSLPMIAQLPTSPTTDAAGAYLIATEADWNWLAKNGTVPAKLTNDITFTYDPLTIDEWNGTLDGQGHTLTIPEDVWLAREGSAGLFGMIRNGTVRNLTIDLKGRVLTRASRWNDAAVAKGSTASTCPDNVYVGVLAAELRANSRIENVKINLAAGAEVEGVYRTGVLAGNAYAPQGAMLVVSNVVVEATGMVTNLNINSSETVLELPANAKAGTLVGHVQQPTGESTVCFTHAYAVNADGTVSLVGAAGEVVRNDGTALKAYLLKCDLAEVDEKLKAFKFTAEDLAALMRGEELKTINGLEFNGSLKISETPISNGKLYKATLTR